MESAPNSPLRNRQAAILALVAQLKAGEIDKQQLFAELSSLQQGDVAPPSRNGAVGNSNLLSSSPQMVEIVSSASVQPAQSVYATNVNVREVRPIDENPAVLYRAKLENAASNMTRSAAPMAQASISPVFVQPSEHSISDPATVFDENSWRMEVSQTQETSFPNQNRYENRREQLQATKSQQQRLSASAIAEQQRYLAEQEKRLAASLSSNYGSHTQVQDAFNNPETHHLTAEDANSTPYDQEFPSTREIQGSSEKHAFTHGDMNGYGSHSELRNDNDQLSQRPSSVWDGAAAVPRIDRQLPEGSGKRHDIKSSDRSFKLPSQALAPNPERRVGSRMNDSSVPAASVGVRNNDPTTAQTEGLARRPSLRSLSGSRPEDDQSLGTRFSTAGQNSTGLSDMHHYHQDNEKVSVSSLPHPNSRSERGQHYSPTQMQPWGDDVSSKQSANQDDRRTLIQQLIEEKRRTLQAISGLMLQTKTFESPPDESPEGGFLRQLQEHDSEDALSQRGKHQFDGKQRLTPEHRNMSDFSMPRKSTLDEGYQSDGAVLSARKAKPSRSASNNVFDIDEVERSISQGRRRASEARSASEYRLLNGTGVRRRRRAADLQASRWAECTFRPQVNPPPAYIQNSWSEQNFFDRVMSWQDQKQVVQEQLADQRKQAELDGCTFQPSITPKAKRMSSRSRVQADVNERLYQEAKENRHTWDEIKKHIEDEEVRRTCTFQPQINRRTRSNPTLVESRYKSTSNSRRSPSPSPLTAEYSFTPRVNKISRNMSSAKMYLSTPAFDRLSQPRSSSPPKRQQSAPTTPSRQNLSFHSTANTSIITANNTSRPHSPELSSRQPHQRNSRAPSPDSSMRLAQSPDSSMRHPSPSSALPGGRLPAWHSIRSGASGTFAEVPTRMSYGSSPYSGTGDNPAKIEEFLERQKQKELAKQERLQKIKGEIDRKYAQTRKMSKKSAEIMKNSPQEAFFNRLERSKSAREEKVEEVKKVVERDYTFRPRINPESQALRARSPEERSFGDAKRVATKLAALKKQRDELAMDGVTFQPQTIAAANTVSVQGKLRILSDPESYMERIQEENKRIQQRRQEVKMQAESQELADCTFRPEVHEAPAYVRRIANSMQRLREATSPPRQGPLVTWR